MSNKQMTASTSVRIRMDDVKVFGPGIAELLYFRRSYKKVILAQQNW